MSHHKKFIVVLIALIAVIGYLVFLQIQKMRGIVNTYAETPIVSTVATYIPIAIGDPSLGNPGAALWIVEFSDLGCARCHEAHYAITKFIKNNPEKARLIWKDAPVTSFVSMGNLSAHIAADCAHEQGQFWKFVELTMGKKNNLTEAGLVKTATALKMDMDKWNTCRASDAAKTKVIESMALAKAIGVSDLPGIFVNNKKINLTSDINIEELLNKLSTKPE
ncbi:MAG: thioredoxin domain-containing protein [Candidatus Magasanikbacteria bacterium]|jgi:protein-disulfide isomerase